MIVSGSAYCKIGKGQMNRFKWVIEIIKLTEDSIDNKFTMFQ